MAETKSITLTNAQVLYLTQWLNVQMLHGKESRARSRFVKLLAPRQEEIEKERIALLAKFSDKDKEGKPLIVQENYSLSPENQKKYQEEWAAYMSEPFVLDILPSNSNEVELVKQTLLNTNDSFSNEIDPVTKRWLTTLSAQMYSEICEAFEGDKK